MDYIEKKQVRRDLKFEHPFTMLVAGPTGSGKTELIRQIIENNRHTIYNLEGNPKVLWCYGIYQKIYDVPIPNVTIEYYEGLPLEEYLKKYKYDIVVIDDLMTDIKKDGEVEKLYTRCSHHAGISMIFTVQNLFTNYIRTISLNCHYIILTKNPRDKSQIDHIGRQVFGKGKLSYLREVYDDATSTRYGYLIIDTSNNLEDDEQEYRLRTNILPVSGVVHQISYPSK